MPNEDGLFSQEEVNLIAGEARMKARTKAQTEFEATQAKANEDAELANLAAKDEWQKLAAKSESRVKALEPLEAQVQQYETLIEGMLEDKVKALGEKAKKVLATLPESMGALDRLAWLNANAEMFQEGTDSVLGTPSGKRKKSGTKADSRAKHRRIRL